MRPFLLAGSADSPLATERSADDAFSRQRFVLGWTRGEDPAAKRAELLAALAAKKTPEKTLGSVRALFELESPATLAQAAHELFAPAQQLGAAETQQLARLCQDAWMADLETLCEARRSIVAQERWHAWLHGWLTLLHIPLSVALLVLVAVHIVVSLYY